MAALPAMTLSSGASDFIDDAALTDLLAGPPPAASAVREVIAKSLAKQALSVAETATLVRADDPALVEEIFQAARQLKQDVYGNRIVLFAPLYVGSACLNDCAYCAFKKSNPAAVRKTLSQLELRRQVDALERVGHKRLILVFGEHPDYDAKFIADCVRTVYAVKSAAPSRPGEIDAGDTPGRGEIRRVNINAAPMDIAGFRTIKDSGIGTYQVFQETYHHGAYAKYHPAGTRKGDYLFRQDALSRAFEAGCDDMGIGALFGLHDWRFEVLGLVSHALYLQGRFGVGPHTISFPRVRPASGVSLDKNFLVPDEEFKRVIAILRLAVPYTGLILTARESPALRREAMSFGVSQIDAGSRIEIGGYTLAGDAQVVECEQFELGDIRPLDAVIRELIASGELPSFCTACYRVGRTGEQFMEYAIPGFIQRFCTPNALTTLLEYLVDYASLEIRAAGEKLLAAELAKMPDSPMKQELADRLKKIQTTDARDLYF